MAIIAKVGIVRIGRRPVAPVGSAARMNIHQLTRLSDSKRRKQNRFHQTEKRGIHSNTQRQRKKRYSRESRILGEVADGITKIASEIINISLPPYVSNLFFHAVQA